jgi:ATP-dependent Lon protease
MSIGHATVASLSACRSGGVRDEAEDSRPPPYLHRRPARPDHPDDEEGRHHEPIFVLDEVDKMSMDFRGDPSAAYGSASTRS